MGERGGENDVVVHLNPETLLPVGVSKPCPSMTVAVLGFKGLSGVRVPCGNLAGHDGPHVFHVEWTDPIPAPLGTPQNPVDGATHPCPSPGYAGRHTAVGAGAISPPYVCHGCGTWFLIPPTTTERGPDA